MSDVLIQSNKLQFLLCFNDYNEVVESWMTGGLFAWFWLSELLDKKFVGYLVPTEQRHVQKTSM